MASTKQLGILGETITAQYLSKHGYKILERNFKCKFGEIDIIAIHKDYLVIIEVKTRWSEKYGKPEEAVTPRKLAKLYRLADYYMATHTVKKIKMEVAAVEITDNTYSIKIIRVD